MHMHNSFYMFVFEIFPITPRRCLHTIHPRRNPKIFNTVLLARRPGWDFMRINKDCKAIAFFVLIGHINSRFQHNTA